MIRCPQCSTEILPAWDWCHVCGFNPDGPPRPPTAAAPGSASPSAPPMHALEVRATPAPPGVPPPRYAAPPAPSGGPNGGPSANRTVVIVAAVGVVAVLLVLVAVVTLGRPSDPTEATASGPTSSLTTTTRRVMPAWTLPDGGLTVDLPVTPEPVAAPAAAFPYVTTAAYQGTDGERTFVVAAFAVHPDYTWEDANVALIDAVDEVAAQHGYSLVTRTAGAHDGKASSRFTFVEARRTDESEADFQARADLGATGEGIALVDSNRLYLVAVQGTSLGQAEFRTVLDSLVLA